MKQVLDSNLISYRIQQWLHANLAIHVLPFDSPFKKET